LYLFTTLRIVGYSFTYLHHSIIILHDKLLLPVSIPMRINLNLHTSHRHTHWKNMKNKISKSNATSRSIEFWNRNLELWFMGSPETGVHYLFFLWRISAGERTWGAACIIPDTSFVNSLGHPRNARNPPFRFFMTYEKAMWTGARATRKCNSVAGWHGHSESGWLGGARSAWRSTKTPTIDGGYVFFALFTGISPFCKLFVKKN